MLLHAVLWTLDTAGFRVTMQPVGNEGIRGTFGQDALPRMREQYGPHTNKLDVRFRSLIRLDPTAWAGPHPLMYRDKLHRRAGFPAVFVRMLSGALAAVGVAGGDATVLEARLWARLDVMRGRMRFGFGGRGAHSGAHQAPLELRLQWCSEGGHAAFRQRIEKMGGEIDDPEDRSMAMVVSSNSIKFQILLLKKKLAGA